MALPYHGESELWSEFLWGIFAFENFKNKLLTVLPSEINWTIETHLESPYIRLLTCVNFV